MALDGNLFTLAFVPRKYAPQSGEQVIVDLVDEKTQNPYYCIGYDGERTVLAEALSEAPLAETGPQPDKPKHRDVKLHNPEETVEFKSTGSIRFEWTFIWTEDFHWRRDVVSVSSTDQGYSLWMNRKPDPPIICAIYKPPTKQKPGFMQVLDYNLARVEIDDRKGFEIVCLVTLGSLLRGAYTSAGGSQSESPATTPNVAPTPSILGNAMPSPAGSPNPSTINRAIPPPSSYPSPIPPVPNDEEPMLDDWEIDEPNLILVSNTQSSAVKAIERGCRLLEDPLLVYLNIRSRDQMAVLNVVRVAAEIKRMHFKKGGEDLIQYSVQQESQGPRHQRVLQLDAPEARRNQNWTPPHSLSIYLSRQTLDELAPSKTSTFTNNNLRGGPKSTPTPPPPRPPKEKVKDHSNRPSLLSRTKWRSAVSGVNSGGHSPSSSESGRRNSGGFLGPPPQPSPSGRQRPSSSLDPRRLTQWGSGGGSQRKSGHVIV